VKKITAFFIVTFTMFFINASIPAQAASHLFLDHVEKKTPTDPLYIALLFYRMTGHELDFASWAQDNNAYRDAPDGEKEKILNTQKDKLQSIFYDINPDEQIVVELNTTISGLDKAKIGFYISSFRPELFFNFTYLSNNYAVVPLGVEKYKWFLPTKAELKHIKAAGAIISQETPVDIQFIMTPKSADGRAPATFGKTQHWLLSAQIEEIQVWTKDGKILWQIERTTTQDKLMDLYKK